MRVEIYLKDYTKKVGVFIADKLISKHCDFYHAQITKNSKKYLRLYGSNTEIKPLKKVS